MGYEITVFDVAKAPKKRAEFLKWYETLWEADDYSNINLCSQNLKDWLYEIIESFPAAEGPYNENEQEYTFYYVGDGFICGNFPCEPIEKFFKAYNLAVKLAEKYGLGLFESGKEDGLIIMPDRSIMDGDPREELERKIDLWSDDDEYQKIIDAIIAFPDKDADMLLSLAINYNNVNEYEKAVEVLNAIKDECEDQDHWYYVMGYSLRYLGRFEEATKYFEKAIEMDPYQVIHSDVLSYCYYKAGNKEKALSQTKKCVEAKMKYAEQYCDDESYKEVIESLENECPKEVYDDEVRTSLAYAYYKTGSYYLKQNRTKDAKSLLEKAIEIEPDNKTYAEKLSECSRKAN